MNNMTDENIDQPTPDTTGAGVPEHELEDAKVEQSDPVAALEVRLSEMQDKYLRLVAEFENFKKRTVRERMDLLKTASADSMLAILPVMDDFERAIKAGADTGSPLNEGILLIYTKLKSSVESKGLKAMEAVGKPFDSELHDAIVQVPAPSEQAKGNVLEEVTKGYYLNEKVLRHAKVVVAI